MRIVGGEQLNKVLEETNMKLAPLPEKERAEVIAYINESVTKQIAQSFEVAVDIVSNALKSGKLQEAVAKAQENND
jgi:hypothetical protein